WLYFIRQDFDFYYAGYLDTWAGLTGAIGMTHETDGGRVLARERNDGSILTLRDGIEKHFTSALAVIEAAGERRRDLLTSYVAFKRKAVTGEHAGKMRQVVVPPHQPGWDELATVLGRHGIRVAYAAASYRQTMTDYWSGETKLVEVPAASMIIDLAQPQGPLAKALLERGSDFEPEFIKQQLRKREERRKEEKYPAPDDFDFYDMTGWSLIYLFGLNAYHSEELAPIIVAGAEIAREVPPSLVDEGTGWAHFPSDDREMVKLAELLRQDVRAAVITRASSAGSMNLPPGTVMVLRGRNDPDAFEKVRRSGLPFVNVSTAYPGSGADGPGSWSVRPLARPEIGIVFGSGGLNADFPYAWYVFDRVFKMPYTPLATGALSGDLSRYSCILVPSNLGSIPDRLREWVRQGGCLVVLGNPQWAVGDGRLVSLEQVKQDPAPMSVPGAIFRARLDQRSFLSWGVGRSEIAVPVDGSRFYRAKKEGGSVVTFDADENTTKLLSGWVWPDETEKLLAGAVWLHEEPVGRGRVVVFTQDPLDRAMWPGLHRLLLNAMLFGPGL
ncbi:MAG TPA: hypothetical protein VM328_05230, partial [Fimbriimonadaceae bacterium]|nr:hypothetical protein [Fimbriimonadaceae bacterium]